MNWHVQYQYTREYTFHILVEQFWVSNGVSQIDGKVNNIICQEMLTSLRYVHSNSDQVHFNTILISFALNGGEPAATHSTLD
jgi:hypothetical protein